MTIDDFAKIEMRVGKVIEAAFVEGSEKLIRQVVDFGAEGEVKDTRVIFSGIRKWYGPDDMVGKSFVYVTNLEPRKMPSFIINEAGEQIQEYSQGMILAVDGPEGKPVMLTTVSEVGNGAKVR